MYIDMFISDIVGEIRVIMVKAPFFIETSVNVTVFRGRSEGCSLTSRVVVTLMQLQSESTFRMSVWPTMRTSRFLVILV